MGVLVPLVKQVPVTPMSHPDERIGFPFLGRLCRATLENSRLRRLHNLPFREDVLQSS